MIKLWNKLMPFATDSTGVCSLFCDADAVVIGHDPGATALRCYGFTEKRDDKTAAYAGMPVGELSCVMGDNEMLIDNYMSIINRYSKNMVAFVGTPVSTLLNFDLRGLAKQLEKRTGATVMAFSTTGNKYYDRGLSDAFSVIFDRFVKENDRTEVGDDAAVALNESSERRGINLLGLNTLDIPWNDAYECIRRKAGDAGYDVLSVWGMQSDRQKWEKSASAELNVICSASAYRIAERMKQRYGIPYVTLDELMLPLADDIISGNTFSDKISVLVIGEQLYANGIRKALKAMGAANVDVAGFFDMNRNYMEKNDAALKSENDLEKLLAERRYDLIIGDPLFRFFINKKSNCVLFPVKHPPVSGNFSRKMRSYDPYDKYFFRELCSVSHSIAGE